MKKTRTPNAASPAARAARKERESAPARLLPTLLASSACGLLASPALALQLGEIDVQSGLGQPLRASIAYALSPNERLHDYCIYIRPTDGVGLPGISQARLSVTGSRIFIEGRAPLREPMVSLGIAINCPYTANLTRSYTIMLDPVTETVAAPARTIEAPTAAQPASEPVFTRRAEPVATTPIGPSSTYRVRGGDSLSTIVGRIENRELSLWDAVEVVFAANPDAFIDGDMNKLKAGSLLTIPSLDGQSVAVVTAQETPAADPIADSGVTSVETEAPAAADTVTSGYEGFPETTAPAETALPAGTEEPVSVAPAEPVAESVDQTEDLRPGDVSFGTDSSFVSPIESVPAGDAINADAVQADSTVTAAAPAATSETSGNMLYGLLGTGLALLAGLVFFGRRLRRDEPLPPTPVEDDQTIADDEPTAQNRALTEADVDVDFDIGDMSVAATASQLDADLAAGTGFDATRDVEVAQDFAFSTTRDLGADLDVVLPENTGEDESTRTSTDIIPAQRAEEHTILEREILPTEDDEYDLSMIVDATKQRYSEDGDVTAKELQAIAVDGDDIEEGDEDYTLSNEVDYHILEQDYEEELSATQALNAEILRAAEDLAARLDDDSEVDTEEVATISEAAVITAEQTALLDAEEMLGGDDADDATTEMPARTAEADNTVEMVRPEADEDESIEGDRTEEIPAASTESRRRLDETMAATELTEELPSAQNDSTAELEVESGHFRTRKTAN